MTVQAHEVRNAIALRDSYYTHRWYDAFGERVCKYLQEFVAMPVDDTTHDPTPEWTLAITEVGGATTTDITDLAGGGLLITAAGNEDDGIQMQLGHGSTGAGENVDLSGAFPLYCGIEFALSDADQSDLLFGVCVTDVDCLGAVTDGMYFRTVDESAALYFVTEKDSVEGATAVATLADGIYTTAEFYFDGNVVYAYINGALLSSTADSSATFPNDELMRLTFEFLSGAAVANTCTIRWMRMIHVR